MLTTAWGEDPALIVRACAVGAVARLVAPMHKLEKRFPPVSRPTVERRAGHWPTTWNLKVVGSRCRAATNMSAGLVWCGFDSGTSLLVHGVYRSLAARSRATQSSQPLHIRAAIAGLEVSPNCWGHRPLVLGPEGCIVYIRIEVLEVVRALIVVAWSIVAFRLKPREWSLKPTLVPAAHPLHHRLSACARMTWRIGRVVIVIGHCRCAMARRPLERWSDRLRLGCGRGFGRLSGRGPLRGAEAQPHLVVGRAVVLPSAVIPRKAGCRRAAALQLAHPLPSRARTCQMASRASTLIGPLLCSLGRLPRGVLDRLGTGSNMQRGPLHRS